MHTTHDWTIAYRNPNEPHFHRVTNWCGTWDDAFKMSEEFGNRNPQMETWYVGTRQSELNGNVVSEDVANVMTEPVFDSETGLCSSADSIRVPLVDDGKLNEMLMTWAKENNVGHETTKEHRAEFVLYDYGRSHHPRRAMYDLRAGHFCSRHLIHAMRDPDRKGHCLATLVVDKSINFVCDYDGYFE